MLTAAAAPSARTGGRTRQSAAEIPPSRAMGIVGGINERRFFKAQKGQRATHMEPTAVALGRGVAQPRRRGDRTPSNF